MFISAYKPPSFSPKTETCRTDASQAKSGLTYLDRISSAQRKSAYAELAVLALPNGALATKRTRVDVKNFTEQFAKAFSHFENAKKAVTAPPQPKQVDGPRARELSTAISEKCAYFEQLSKKPETTNSQAARETEQPARDIARETPCSTEAFSLKKPDSHRSAPLLEAIV